MSVLYRRILPLSRASFSFPVFFFEARPTFASAAGQKLEGQVEERNGEKQRQGKAQARQISFFNLSYSSNALIFILYVIFIFWSLTNLHMVSFGEGAGLPRSFRVQVGAAQSKAQLSV